MLHSSSDHIRGCVLPSIHLADSDNAVLRFSIHDGSQKSGRGGGKVGRDASPDGACEQGAARVLLSGARDIRTARGGF